MRKATLVLAAVLSVPCSADTLRLPVTRDVGICAHPKEVALNTGGNAHVRVKGNEHYYLFDFEAQKLRAHHVTKATLHVKLGGGHLRRVAFCTVPCAWVEGTAVNKPQAGSTCFTHVKYPTHTWPLMGATQPPEGKEAHTGGTLLAATFNSPHMLWRASDVKAGQGGWLEIPIDPRLVQACAVGLSHGLVMAEEKGQTRENHDIFTREQSNARPYLTVEAEPWHVAGGLQRLGVKVEPLPAESDFDGGAISVDPTMVLDSSGRKQEGVLGHRLTIANRVSPLAPLSQEDAASAQHTVTFHDTPVVFRHLKPGRKYAIQAETFVGPQRHEGGGSAVGPPALDAPGKPQMKEGASVSRLLTYGTGEWSWRLLRTQQEADPAEKGPLHAIAGAAGQWPSMPVPVAPRNAWVGLQAVVLPPGGKAGGVSVELKDLRDARKERLRTFAPLTQIRLYRVWYVRKGKDPHAEVLVPLREGERFDIPWGANDVQGQANQAIFVDVWVPKNAGPVPYEGTLAVSQDGKKVAEIPVAVDVADAALPDEFHIVADMNTYDSPARAMGAKTSDPKAFIEMERKYYRLAHAHRMTLNVLPYSQSGSIHWRGAP